MARLIDRLTRSNLPDPEQVALLTSMWPGQSTERVMQTFKQYAAFGFSANSAVFACEQARFMLLAQAQFKFRNKTTGKLYTTAALAPLQTPWPNGTTADLIVRAELNGALAGNAYIRRTADGVTFMRPDWTDIMSVLIVDGYDHDGVAITHRETLGYLYSEGGIGIGEGAFVPVEDVAHWTPIPDPLSDVRGMSYLTPVLREINADVSMTQHRQLFFDNAGTPNLILKYTQKLQPQTLDAIRDRWRARFGGPTGSGSTVVLDEGADLTVVGSTFESMRFNDLQSAGEARIAAAAGVPPIVANLAAGLDAATYSNYGQAIRNFAAGTCAFLWGSLASALSKLVDVPADSELWYDTANIPALREDENSRAANMQVLAAAASTLLAAGYTPDSITTYLQTGDLGQLQHSGLVSVQLYKAEAKQEAVLSTKDPVVPAASTDPNPPVKELKPARADVLLEALVARAAEPAPQPVEQHFHFDGMVQTTVERADVHVDPTPVTVDVAPAAVTVRNDVAPTPVTIDNHVEPTPVRVDVAAPAAPDVTVVAKVELPARKTVTQVDRDARTGLIKKTIATETDA